MIMEKLIANYDFLKYGGFAMLALAGLPAMYNAARETGWGAAMLVSSASGSIAGLDRCEAIADRDARDDRQIIVAGNPPWWPAPSIIIPHDQDRQTDPKPRRWIKAEKSLHHRYGIDPLKTVPVPPVVSPASPDFQAAFNMAAQAPPQPMPPPAPLVAPAPAPAPAPAAKPTEPPPIAEPEPEPIARHWHEPRHHGSDVCERHGMRRVETKNGKSWRCRK